MTGFPSNGPWAAIRADLDRPGRRLAAVAIGYVGTTAPHVMPLRAGDVLICDASRPAIRQGLTSASALARYRRKGVEIFSLPGLHAKVVAFPTSAWVGSANASLNSANNLVEASVRVTGEQARKVRRWVESLATGDRSLSTADITGLRRITVAARRSGPQREERVVELPRTLQSLIFVETGEALTRDEVKTVQEDRQNYERIDPERPSRLDYIFLYGPTRIREGHWVIDVRNNHPRRPALVTRVSRRRGASIVWMDRVTTTTRPTIAELRDACPRLEPDFGELKTANASTIRRVLDFYR